MNPLASWLPARPASVRVEALDAGAAARLAAVHGSAFARPWSTLDFERLLSERSVLADGLFVGRSNKPSGFVLSRRVSDEAEILSLAVAPDGRGRGYARLLLMHHLQDLSLQGVRAVHLEVEEGNAPALALYRRLGFREIGRRPAYYAKPDGAYACALTMSLVF